MSTIREVRAAGLEALELATQLLQRARLADPVAGLWEAADVAWSWRIPRLSDAVEKPFWLDDHGPVAGVLLTTYTDDVWQVDPIVTPGATSIDPHVLWNRALELGATHAPNGFDVPVDDDDRVFLDLARRSGFTVSSRDGTAWMDAGDQPAIVLPREGFVLIDRNERRETPHAMRHRSGDSVAERLQQCALYDPTLDFAVETEDGQLAGYSLFWFDPITKVGLVEPVRVEDEFQRQGLARAMLSVGIGRLFSRGANRVKVSYETEAAASLYLSLGFRQSSTTAWYRASTSSIRQYSQGDSIE